MTRTGLGLGPPSPRSGLRHLLFVILFDPLLFLSTEFFLPSKSQNCRGLLTRTTSSFPAVVGFFGWTDASVRGSSSQNFFSMFSTVRPVDRLLLLFSPRPRTLFPRFTVILGLPRLRTSFSFFLFSLKKSKVLPSSYFSRQEEPFTSYYK